MEAGVAVYANYTRVTLAGGKQSVVDGYMGGFANMFANKTSIRFQYAPSSVLVDLRTMKVLASGTVSVSKAISTCSSLPDE